MSRVVVITGASGGVGRATARKFAARGDRIALLARGSTGLHGAAEDVRAAGGTALPIEADVARYQDVDTVAARVERELGPIDVWVNNAFSSVFAPVTDISPAEFRRVTEVTYLGTVHGTLAALKRMRDRGHGTIVQTGSALGHRSIPLQSAYCAAKHAIVGFTESLRCELRHDRSPIKLTIVALPAVNTPQFDWLIARLPKPARPVPPIYQPELAADAIVYAADHPRRAEYWVGASTVGTLLGQRIAPRLLDRYLARTGYRAQQADREPPDAPPNLWRPADGSSGHDHGAHGAFDDSAHPRSLQWWLVTHRVRDALGAALVAGTSGWLWHRRRTG